MTDRLRTFDVQLWVTADQPQPAVMDFFRAVRELALEHDGIDLRWVNERFDREGGPRVRKPPDDDHDDAGRDAR